MKKRCFFVFLTLFFAIFGLFPVGASFDYDTVIFALNSKIAICDGEACENVAEPYKSGNDIVIPEELAEKYFGVYESLNEKALKNMGYDVFESYKYGFIAVGNLSGINFETEEEIIKKFGIYVSEDGDDNAEGYPGFPVKTFEAAQALYRERGGIIYVHSGIYRRTNSFTVDKNDNKMVIKAYGDGVVSVRGSKRLPKVGFKKASEEEVDSRISKEAKNYIYVYDLSDMLDSISTYPQFAPQVGATNYYELFSDNIPQAVARYPDYSYELTKEASGNSFTAPAEKLEKWQNEPYGMLNGYWVHNWAMENIYIGSVDLDMAKVTLSKETVYGDIVNGQRYYAMNMLCELDRQGEYYIDADAKKLYYYPTDSFLKDNIELSVITEPLLKVNGTENLKISGLTFEYTRGNAISLSSGSNISIENCSVRNIGNVGIYSRSEKTSVKGCEIYNIGGMGIDMSAGNAATMRSGASLIENNNIYNFGRTFKTYQTAVMISGFGNKVQYNTIHDAPHAAIRYGGGENIISHNEIYNVVTEASDSGAIYAGRNWTCWGNEISYNYFHDITKKEGLVTFTVSVVYVDDMLSGTIIKNNVFENCTQAALIGGGRGNKFNDNIMIDCEYGINYDDRAVTGNWANGSVVSGGTVYEGFVSFLANSDVQATLSERKNRYSGFSEAVADVEAYQKDNSYEMGYPKNAEIKNNKSCGKNALNENYDGISQYVPLYGEVSGNTYQEEPISVQIPENGADMLLWSNGFEAYEPKINENSVELLWNHSGADYYNVIVTNENGETVSSLRTNENGCALSLIKKGKYNWKISAVCGSVEKTAEGSLEIQQNSNSENFKIETDFEGMTLESLKKDFGWSFGIADGDSLSLEKDDSGNTYLRMERNESNLKSGKATYAKMNFAPVSSGMMTVSFDIMLENYRGGFHHLGSIQTFAGGDIMRLLTHQSWVYCMTTAGYPFDLSVQPNDEYLTVKRIINFDDNTYDMAIYKGGARIGAIDNQKAGSGTAEAISFYLGYQSPYEPSDKKSGNGVYRIDNINIDYETDFCYGTDFEDVTLKSLTADYGWSFGVADGDSLSLEKDDNGNSYLRLERSENNLKSGSPTYANFDFSPIEKGKITVTFDIMLENYRGGFKDLGTVKSKNGDIMRLLTHYDWVYGVSTSGYNYPLSSLPNNEYLTIKRIIDIDNGTYDMIIYKGGEKIEETSGWQSGKDVANSIIFSLQYQAPYQSYDSNIGNAVYRIDNVYVDKGKADIVEAYPKNNSENVQADSEIYVKMNTDISDVSYSNVKIYENGEQLTEEEYSLSTSGRKINIKPAYGLKDNSEYTVEILNNLEISSASHSKMAKNYEFSFKTKKPSLTLLNYEISDENVKLSLDESFDLDAVQLYRYSVKSDFSVSKSGNELIITPISKFNNNERVTVKIGDDKFDFMNIGEIKTENIETDNIKNVTLSFNENISDIKETAVKKDGSRIYNYSVKIKENKITFIFPSGMRLGSEYTFMLRKLKFENGDIINISEKITPEKAFTASKIYYSGDSSRVYAESNTEKYNCIAVTKNFDGALESINAYNGKTTGFFENKKNSEKEYFEYFFWESLNGLTPLVPKVYQ